MDLNTSWLASHIREGLACTKMGGELDLLVLFQFIIGVFRSVLASFCSLLYLSTGQFGGSAWYAKIGAENFLHLLELKGLISS